MVRYHCYEKLGKKCIIKTSSQEVFKKYTGIFAISTNGCIGYEIYKNGGIDILKLIEFLKKFIIDKYTNKLIILDNASSHRNQEVKNIINTNNEVLYTIPYQHYTNAIEQFFSILKNRIKKKKSIGLKELENNVKNILEKEIKKNIYKNLLIGNYRKDIKKLKIKQKSTHEKNKKIYKT